MSEWLIPLISILGSVCGGYLGVRVTVARLEVQVIYIDGVIKTHTVTLEGLEKRLGPLESDVERMKKDIGTHDTGMRGELHAHTQFLTAHELRLHSFDKIPVREV